MTGKLANGKPVFGPYIHEFYTAGLSKIAAAAGADFLIFDYEHSGWTTESLRTQIALARGAGLVPIATGPRWGAIEAPGLGITVDEDAVARFHEAYLSEGAYLPYSRSS